MADSSSRWQLRAWSKDGAVRHVEMSLCAIRAADGRTTHWVAAFRDRSETERLRAELETLKTLASIP